MVLWVKVCSASLMNTERRRKNNSQKLSCDFHMQLHIFIYNFPLNFKEPQDNKTILRSVQILLLQNLL